MAERNGKQKPQRSLNLTYPDAAGIDIGSKSHFVAVPADRAEASVREFKTTTAELKRLAEWLAECQITAVAMESTGVYWIPLYELLADLGFEVHLVNTRQVRHVPGRKSDVLDCQWLQQLMSFGLLRGAFRPGEPVCALRSLVRQRSLWLRDQGRQIQHMQKALIQMNIQLSHVIADLAGATGQKILRAIVAGERDGRVLAGFRDCRMKASQEEIAQSLEGTWRHEHLFALKQALAGFDFCGRQLAECDEEIERQLKVLQVHPDEPQAPTKSPCGRRNAPKFDVRTQLFKVCGVDLTRIPGVNTTTALVVLSEIGPDLSRFPSAKHFASWLGLSPGTQITGGKRISGATRKVKNRATHALKLGAASLRQSKSALGAHYRRLCSRMSKPEAITAAAHKIARLIHALITKGQEYSDAGQDYFEERYRERVLKSLTKRAQLLGMILVPTEETKALKASLAVGSPN